MEMTNAAAYRWSLRILNVVAVVPVLLGAVVLAAWHMREADLARTLLALAPVPYYSGLSFIVSGIGLMLAARGWRWLSASIAMLLGLVAAAAVRLGTGHPWEGAAGAPPAPVLAGIETISLGSATSLALTAAGILLMSLRPFRSRALTLGLLGAMLIALASVAIVSELLYLPRAYGWESLTRMVPAGAFTFVFLGLGIVAFAWTDGRKEVMEPPAWLPLLAAVAVITATLMLWATLVHLEREHIARTVKLESGNVQNEILGRMQPRILALVRMAKRWEEFGPLERRQWEFEASLNQKEYQGYRSIEWVDPDLRVRWRTPAVADSGSRVAEEPLDDERKEQFIQARERKEVTLTRLELPTGETAFSAQVPLFLQGRFAGFIVGVFATQELLEQILGTRVAAGYGIAVFDGETPLFQRYDPAYPDSPWSQEARLDLHGMAWRIRIWPQPSLLNDIRSAIPGFVLVSGFVLALLLTSSLYLMQTSRLRSRQVANVNRALIGEIGERKRAEADLRASEARYKGLFESIRDAIVVTDVNRHHIVGCNPAFVQLFGYSLEDLQGRDSRLLYQDDKHFLEIERALESRPDDPPVTIVNYRKRSGEMFPGETGVFYLKDGAQRVIGLIGLIRDVTERRRAEGEIERKTTYVHLLRSVAAACNHADGVGEAARTCLREMCQAMQWMLGHFRLRDAAGHLVSTGVWHVEGAEQEALRCALEEKVPAVREALAARALTEGVPVRHYCGSEAPPEARALGINAAFAVPVTVRAEVVGVLEFCAAEKDEPDDSLVETLAQIGTHLGRVIERVQAQTEIEKLNRELERRVAERTAQLKAANAELESEIGERKRAEAQRAGLLAQEQAARREAERARSRLAFLAEATEVLSSSLDYATTLSNVARLAVPFLADCCLIHMVNDDGSLSRMRVVHVDPEMERLAARMQECFAPERYPDFSPAKVIRTGMPELVPEVAEGVVESSIDDEEQRTLPGELGLKSCMSVPLLARGRTLGVITLALSVSGRHYDAEDLALAEDLAHRCALAADNARLYRSVQEELAERRRVEEERSLLLVHERAAREDAEKGRRRLSFLAEANETLSSSLDYQAILDVLARLGVSFLADWCAVDVEKSPGRFERVAVAHREPERARLARELQRRYPPDPDVESGYPKVIRTGETDFYPEVAESALRAAARDEAHFELMRDLGFRSFICVPLSVGKRILGAVTFVCAESGRIFDRADLALAEDLARRAAIALDNARLYRAAQDEIAERRRAEESLAAETERLAVTLHSIGDGVITTDTQGEVVLLNKVAEALTGWRSGEAAGRSLPEVFNIVHAGTRKPCVSPASRVVEEGGIIELEGNTLLIARDGTERLVTDSGAPIHDRNGRIIGVVIVFRDVTERQRMEEDLIKAQKLESIGVLAGGIAHDFNNILTAILGNIALAKMYCGPGHQAHETLAEAESAFWRARDLTQQLLTFAKGGAPIRKTGAIAELLTDTVAFALRGSSVDYRFAIDRGLWPVKFDAGQMSQVVNNLIINAMQAMPDGGTVEISARNVVLRKKGIPTLAPGRYVKLTFADEGVGIPEEHLRKIFDPYFTTKQKGSGLGLATTYSIIRRHEGHIDVESGVGSGSRFHVYLPASGEAAEQPDQLPEKRAFRGNGRVLVMDDEATVRSVGARLLEGLGYEAALAADGEEAVSLYERALREDRPFSAVILDLTVPGRMGGRECVQRLREIDPAVRAIVSSGYSNDPVMADFGSHGFLGVVAKPYQLKELSEALSRLLNC